MVCPALTGHGELMPFEFGIAALLLVYYVESGRIFQQLSYNSKESSFLKGKYDSSYLMSVIIRQVM
jgi:hypothetical protein